MHQKTARFAATTIALAATLCSASVLANTSINTRDFEGFSLGMDMDLENQGSKLHRDSQFSGRTDVESKSSSILTGITANYRIGLGNNFVIGVGAKLNLADTAVHNEHFFHIYEGAQQFYVSPGYAVSPKTLVYAKLGTASQKAKYYKQSVDFEGSHYGIGLLYALTPQIHVNAEYAINQFSDRFVKTRYDGPLTLKHNTGTLSVGLAYRF